VIHTLPTDAAKDTAPAVNVAMLQAFAAAWAAFPDARWLHDQHFVSGACGVSQWTFS
jgi:hypothetical protein